MHGLKNRKSAPLSDCLNIKNTKRKTGEMDCNRRKAVWICGILVIKNIKNEFDMDCMLR